MIPLSEVCEYSVASTSVNNLNLSNYVTTDNLLPNRGGIKDAANLPPAKTCPSFEKDNILLSNIRPYFKKIWYASFDGGCSTDVLVLKCKNDNFHSKFVYYSLFQDLFFRHMMNGAKGSKMPRGDKDQIMEFQIPAIEKHDQIRIADILSALDAKISLNTRINAELEQLARTIYNYWFVQFDFPISADEAASMGKPGLEGKPYRSSGGPMVWNVELKREVPKGWGVGRLGDFATIKAGGDKPNIFSLEETIRCSIPVYSNGIDNEGLYGFTDKATVHEQSITISARGTIGYCVLRNEPFVPMVRLIVITPHQAYSAKYLYEWFNAHEFKRVGSVQQQLTVPEISLWRVIIPNQELLRKFNEITLSYIAKFEVNKKENQELTHLRDFLLPLLMSGEVGVDF